MNSDSEKLLELFPGLPAGAVVLLLCDNLPVGSEHVSSHGLWGITIWVQWIPALDLTEHGPHLVHHQIDDLVLCVPTDGRALQLAAGFSAVREAVSAPHAQPPDHVPLLGPQEVRQDHGHITLLTGMIRVNGGPVPDVVREPLHTGVTQCYYCFGICFDLA